MSDRKSHRFGRSLRNAVSSSSRSSRGATVYEPVSRLNTSAAHAELTELSNKHYELYSAESAELESQ